MKDLLVHIGLHRTGSTWIQRSFLPCDETGIGDAWPDREDLGRRLIMAGKHSYSKTAILEELQDRCNRVREKGFIPALSHERFSGNPNSGAIDMPLIAERLQDLIPDAKILLVLRDQQSALESIWCQAVRIGLYCSAKDYLRPYDSGDFRIPHFDLEYLCYDGIVDEYVTRFGRENVLVLDFAHLRQDPLAYAGRICSFMGAPEPQKISVEAQYSRPHPLESAMLRRVNLVFRRTSMNPGPPLESKWMYRHLANTCRFVSNVSPGFVRRAFVRTHEKRVADFVASNTQRFRESNRRLRNDFNIELVDAHWIL